MHAHELTSRLKSLRTTMASIEAALDIDKLQREISGLEDAAMARGLWNNQEKAQAVTSKLATLQAEVTRFGSLNQRLGDLQTLLGLAQSEDDADALAEVRNELASVAEDMDEQEIRTLLSGKYDDREALVTIRAEAGGVDAADFALKLHRMYNRWAERHGYEVEDLDMSYADEAGIKSATFAVRTAHAFGTLSAEQGTHRLVRISPFDNRDRRQTSFAAVEILPVVEQTDRVEIGNDELRIDLYRSSGNGGQGVNTTDSAVRLTHLPTGIVVTCQNQRSQFQNRASAMQVLRARVLLRRREEELAKMTAMKPVSAGWGNQMRSYVLHPYQQVKDLRTGHETGDIAAMLDGDIDGFIDAGMRWRAGRPDIAA